MRLCGREVRDGGTGRDEPAGFPGTRGGGHGGLDAAAPVAVARPGERGAAGRPGGGGFDLAGLRDDAPPSVSRPAPGGGRHAHRRDRHRQYLAGRPRATGRLADLQQLERDADSRQLFCGLRTNGQRSRSDSAAADRSGRAADAGPGDRVRGRLPDRASDVPGRRVAGPGHAGRLQSADPAGHGQFEHPLRDLSAHRPQPEPAAGRGHLPGHAAKRGWQPGGRRHSRGAIWRLRRQSQPRGSPAGHGGGGDGQVAGSGAVGQRDRPLGGWPGGRGAGTAVAGPPGRVHRPGGGIAGGNRRRRRRGPG